MLRGGNSDDERERRAGINQQRASYASGVDVEELQAMMARSREIQYDPRNKMHGRKVDDWQSDDEPQRAVRIHTSDQLPRRRKKKGKGCRVEVEQTASDEEWTLEVMRRSLLEKTGNLHEATSSMTSGTRSGSGGAKGTSSKGMPSRSGTGGASHHGEHSPSSSRMSLPSGSRAMVAGGSSSMHLTSPSGSHGAVAAAESSTLGMTTPSGSAVHAAADERRRVCTAVGYAILDPPCLPPAACASLTGSRPLEVTGLPRMHTTGVSLAATMNMLKAFKHFQTFIWRPESPEMRRVIAGQSVMVKVSRFQNCMSKSMRSIGPIRDTVVPRGATRHEF
eukprot:s2986_g10.t1